MDLCAYNRRLKQALRTIRVGQPSFVRGLVVFLESVMRGLELNNLLFEVEYLDSLSVGVLFLLRH